jgi:hypothetical protein
MPFVSVPTVGICRVIVEVSLSPPRYSEMLVRQNSLRSDAGPTNVGWHLPRIGAPLRTLVWNHEVVQRPLSYLSVLLCKQYTALTIIS